MSRRHFVQGEANVLMFHGGAFQGSGKVADSLECDVAAYFDASNELENVQLQPGVIKVPIAPGETVLTLIESDCFEGYDDLLDDVRCLLRDRPGVSLQDGMGQTPIIGFLAAIKLVTEPRFRDVMARIHDALTLKHNALIRRISLTMAGGGGGGTAAGGAEVICRAATDYFLRETSAVIDSEVIRAGGLSYTGISPRIPVNTGATFVRDKEWLHAQDRAPRESRSLILTELPIVVEQRKLRDQFGAQLLQAHRASSTQAQIKLFKPNHATASALGSVMVIRPKYLKTISESKVAGTVANSLVADLDELANQSPQVTDVRRLDLRVNRTVGSALTPDTLAEVASAADIRPTNFVETCMRPVFEHRVRIRAEMADGLVIDPTRPGSSFAICYEAADFRRKLRTCRSLHQRLKDMQVQTLEECEGTPTRAERIEELRRDRQSAVNRVKLAVDGVFPKSLMQKLRYAVAGPQSKLDEFRDAVARFQETDGEFRRLEAEIAALTIAQERVASESKAEIQRLQRVKKILQPHCDRHLLGQSEQLVTVRSVDGVLRELLGMSVRHDQTNNDRIVCLLTKCVAAVTMAGLAEITGADNPNPEDIACILAFGAPRHEAPIWGATDPRSDGTTLVVLPPVESKLEESIRHSLAVMAPDKILVSSDTAQGGVNIVYLQIWKPTRINDICDQYLINKIKLGNNRINMPTGDSDALLSSLQGTGNGHV